MIDRIALVEPYLFPADLTPHLWWSHNPYVFVRVETGDGIVGWGECHLCGYRADALVAMVRTVGEWLVGRPSGDIRGALTDCFGAFGQQRPGLEVYSAFAGVELALWDILGKRLDVPIYQLLGGACHDTIPVYANLYSPKIQMPDRFAEMAAQQVAAGHKVIKLYPFKSDVRIKDGVAALSAVREAVGPDIGLAIDLWRHASPTRTIEIARAVERFDLLWLEDPFAPSDAVSYRYVRDAIGTQLVTGETLPSRREFQDLFAKRAVDIVNPDICQTGLLEFQAIAATAETHFVSVSPHNSNSMALGTAAAVHAALGIPNLDLTEYFPLFETAMDGLCTGRMPVRNGEVDRPRTAGHGIEFDTKAMQKYRL